MRLFFDADVLFSASYSNKGATFLLLTHKTDKLQKITSKKCIQEAEVALKKYGKNLHPDIKSILNVYERKSLAGKYDSYVRDGNDEHVIAAAIELKANLLTTYNVTDFKIENIRRDFATNILRPKEVLFYMRNVLQENV